MPSESILGALSEALADGSVRAVELSHPLTTETPMIDLPEPFVNAPGLSVEQLSRYDDNGPWFYWNSFSGSEHMGTHFDAPVHWITGRDGEDVSQIPPDKLIGPIVVLDRTPEVAADADFMLQVDDVRALEPLPEGGWLLMRTGWGTRHLDGDAFLNQDAQGPHWPGVTSECARYIAEQTPLRGYGTEQIGIDAGMAYELDPPYPMHYFLLGAGKYGLASLNGLEQLPETGAFLIAAPLRIEGGSGSPARVIALAPT